MTYGFERLIAADLLKAFDARVTTVVLQKDGHYMSVCGIVRPVGDTVKRESVFVVIDYPYAPENASIYEGRVFAPRAGERTGWRWLVWH